MIGLLLVIMAGFATLTVLIYKTNTLKIMDKKQAQNKLNDLQAEVDKLRKIIEAPESKFKGISDYKSFCNKSGMRFLTASDFNNFPSWMVRKQLAQAKIQQFENYFNEGWDKNWANQSQKKYYPFFTLNGYGGLLFYGCLCYGSFFFGIAGFYKDEEIATFVGKTFIDVYSDLR